MALRTAWGAACSTPECARLALELTQPLALSQLLLVLRLYLALVLLVLLLLLVLPVPMLVLLVLLVLAAAVVVLRWLPARSQQPACRRTCTRSCSSPFVTGGPAWWPTTTRPESCSRGKC